jgi:TonB family protein
MNRSTLHRRICNPMKWVFIGIICSSSFLLAEDLKRVSPDEALKAVTSRTKAEYSVIARQLKLSGSVSLDVVIAEDGTVESVSVVKGNPVLAKSAVEAVKQWRFVPFKSEGRAIKVVSEIAMQFNYTNL